MNIIKNFWNRTKKSPVLRGILSVSPWTIGSRITGFVRQTLMAHYLGSTIAMEALALAIKLPSMFRRMFAEGALVSSFVPIFLDIHKTSEYRSRMFARQVLGFLLTCLMILVVVVELFMPTLMRTIFAGFSAQPERLQLLVSYSYMTFPIIIFLGIFSYYSALLDAFYIFFWGAMTPCIGNLVIVMCFLVIFSMGITPGYAFALSVLASGIVHALLPWWGARRIHWNVRPIFCFKGGGMRAFFRLFFPASINAACFQINIILSMMVASFLPKGSIAYLHYAERLINLPVSVVGVALGTVLMPFFCKNTHKTSLVYERKALCVGAFLMSCVGLGMMIGGQEIIRLLFEHGKFCARDTLNVRKALMIFVMALPAYSMSKTSISRILAQKKVAMLSVITACVMVSDVGMAWFLKDTWGFMGIATATVGAAWLHTCALIVWRYYCDPKSIPFERILWIVGGFFFVPSVHYLLMTYTSICYSSLCFVLLSFVYIYFIIFLWIKKWRSWS